METDIPSLRWRQDGVDHVLKLLPGGRIGFLSDELLAQIEAAGGRPDEKSRLSAPGISPACAPCKRPMAPRAERSPRHLWNSGKTGCPPRKAPSPRHCAARPPRQPGAPCIVYFHGGGWQYGSRAIVQPFCRFLAQEADALVVNPEYRLAPEHPWPAGPRTPGPC